MEKVKLVYTASIIDGEGCIYISKKMNERYQLVVNVVNTSKELIDFFFKNFKGNVRVGKKKENQNQFWIWEITNYKDTINFLEQIIPYLLIKREQGELALQFAKQRENIMNFAREKRCYTKEQIQIYHKLKRLKKEYPKELPDYTLSEEEKLYYLAGLIDGEGSVRLTKSKYTNSYKRIKLMIVPQLIVTNTDERISKFLMNEFHGFVMKKLRYGKWRDIYTWYYQGLKNELLLKLKDKLIIKNKQLLLLLDYINLRKQSYVHTSKELEIINKINILNGKKHIKITLGEFLKLTKLIRNPRKFFLEKEKLEDLYLNKKLSIRQIAKLYGVAFDTVRLRIKKYEICLRSSKEGIKLNPPKLTEEGRNKIKIAMSNNKKESWQNPLYRNKMLKNLEIARNIKKQKYLRGIDFIAGQ